VNNYHCGKTFKIDLLQLHLNPKQKEYVIDVNEKTAKLLIKQGDFISTVETLASGISSDHNQGGQSQNRFHRKREQAIKQFCKRILKRSKELEFIEPKYTGNERLINILEDI